MYIITEIEKMIHSSAHMNSSVICFCFACPIMKIRYMPVFFLYSVIIIYYLLLENDCNFFFKKPAKIDYFEYKACQVKSSINLFILANTIKLLQIISPSCPDVPQKK